MKEEKLRKLAAIMFTDITGYTALMQQDERHAFRLRARHRAVFEEQHRIFRGEIIQYFGDGTLSIFDSAVEAATCAVGLQTIFQSDNPVVPIRIGIHLGDIVYSDKDVYGDGVNLASRVENLGIPGAVLLSSKLNDELKNHQQLKTKLLGTFDLKNILDPVDIYCITNKGVVIPNSDDIKGKPQESHKSIAVLPLINMSSDHENEYFSDGMTEEIINALTKVKGLKVTSRSSSFHFKNKNLPTPEIGKQLSVSTILEGSVRLAANKLRITVQLVDVLEDYQFWSETFDRDIENIFSVQDEVSLLVADKLREHLGHLEIEEHLVVDPDVPVDVYKRYLKSRYHLRNMSQPELEKGMAILRDIISSQPNYAYAQLGMHMGYTLMGSLGFMSAPKAFVEGKKYLDRAIELDESLAECQLQLSWVSFLEKWDIDEAYRHLANVHDERPIVDYYQTMASTIVAEGNFRAAWNYIESATQIDPMSEINYHLKGFILYAQERFEEAVDNYRKSIEIRPDSEVSMIEMGQAMILLGNPNGALEYFSGLSEKSDPLSKLGGITLAHAALGNDTETKEGIKKLTDSLESQYNFRAFFLLVYSHVISGNYEEALDLLEKGIELRLPLMVYVNIEPFLKPLKSTDRFKNLVLKILRDRTIQKDKLSKYKKSLLSNEVITMYQEKLRNLMKDSQPYLDPEITLRQLAERLDVPPNQMSQLLNEGFEKNFSDFINSYRLEEFKQKVNESALDKHTILAVAYDSGFNSKTVFNTFFKKKMGQTPKEYARERMN